MINRFTILILVILLAVPTYVFAAKTHKVKKNESFASLAKKYHVSVAALKETNNRVNATLKPGDVLVIPSRVASREAGTDPAVKGAASYKVKKGDTIARVSKKTGVSVAQLKRINGLGKGRLKKGQILALRDNEPEVQRSGRVAVKPTLRYPELLDEKENPQNLTELLDQDVVNVGTLPRDGLKVDNVTKLKSKAFGLIDTPYVFGGSTRNGIDCSAFVQKVFNEMDVNLPRTAREQFEKGEIVTQGDMQKGDLVFFRTYASFPSHVGIYLGNNRMIHASSRDRRVVISTLNTPYYRSRFIGAKRIAKINPDQFNLDELMLDINEESPEDAQGNDLMGSDTVGSLP